MDNEMNDMEKEMKKMEMNKKKGLSTGGLSMGLLRSLFD